jgi:HD-like signal output (HDOD) protein
MIFQGDLSRYHPADALMFLANLNLNGLFSVSSAETIITLAFKNGKLIDAHSPRADRKLVQFLRSRNLLDEPQERRIARIRSETGLSARQILAQVSQTSLSEMKSILLQGMGEALLELFLLEEGRFNFTDAQIEEDSAGICLDTGGVAVTTAVMADEYREFEETHLSLDREMAMGEVEIEEEKSRPVDGWILRMARKGATVRRLLDEAPVVSGPTLKRLEELIGSKVIALRETVAPALADDRPAALFMAYKQALRRLLDAKDVVARLSAIIAFCKEYYDPMLIITARRGELYNCKSICKNTAGALVQNALEISGRLVDEPVFSAVRRSGVGFFGHSFPSALLDELVGPAEGECALIPVHRQAEMDIYFFARCGSKSGALSPHHYLELLSWMTTSKGADARCEEVGAGKPQAGDTNVQQAEKNIYGGESGDHRIAELIARIDDLPPLPALASRALAMLANPDTPMAEIEVAIGQDQALTAKLIQVANSALYSGYQKANSLRQVLTRIGLKTARSLVLASSTRGYFLKNRQGMGLWGRLLWQHAVECGMAARRIASSVGYPDPEEAFTGGLVHDVGKLVILMLFPEKYKEIERIKKGEMVSDKELELRVIGVDHERIGRLLMDKWKMPEAIKACTEFHHRYRETDTFGTLAAIVAYADLLSHMIGAGPRNGVADAETQVAETVQWLGIDDTRQSEIVAAVQNDFQSTDLMI